jgi:hypothetical protein
VVVPAAVVLPPVAAPAVEPPLPVLPAVEVVPEVPFDVPATAMLGSVVPLLEQPASATPQPTKYRGNARIVTVLIPTPAAFGRSAASRNKIPALRGMSKQNRTNESILQKIE